MRHIAWLPYLKEFLRKERDLVRGTLSTLDYASLRPAGPIRGHVLLSYVLAPFLDKSGRSAYHGHTSHGESLQIAQTFLDLGYAVDVFHYNNNDFIPPRKDYTFFIDCRYNLERLSSVLDDKCIKIMHIGIAHITFLNYAEAHRLLEIKRRRGVILSPFSYQKPNLAIEHADFGTILGNEFTMSTFRYAAKPLYPVPVASSFQYPWPAEKDFERVRRRFVWFGGWALVRKGLDLVLEAFATMPEYELFVCGPIEAQPEFRRAYYRELYQTPNIHTIGWVDVAGREFSDVADRCLGLVFPSSCEGQSGGVVTAMHAGLIPLVSYESGVDVDDFGVMLARSDLEEIREVVQRMAERPASELRDRAEAAWRVARTRYTREAFAERYRESIVDIMRCRGLDVGGGSGTG